MKIIDERETQKEKNTDDGIRLLVFDDEGKLVVFDDQLKSLAIGFGIE